MKSGVEIVSHKKFKVIKIYIHLFVFLTAYFVNMTCCVAVGCNSNSFTKDQKKGLKYFRRQKDDWFQNIKRENLPKTPTLCQ